MSRTIRKTGTATIVITASSDSVDGLPPSPPHAGGVPTRVYQDNLTADEVAEQLENLITEWAQQSFPRGGKLFFDLVSVAVVVT